METGSAVRFVEEESHGWTILSTTAGEDQISSLTLIKKDVSTGKTKSGGDGDGDVDDGKAENNQDLGEDQIIGENQISEQGSVDLENHQKPLFDDVVNDDHDDDVGNNGDGDEEEEEKNATFGIGTYSSNQKNLPWEHNINGGGAEGDYERKEGVLEGHLNNKNGCVFWRASLFATLGFIGWAFINNAFNGGSGKDLRCMKLHPCSIKGGGVHHVLDSV